ncbi:MAG TPA: DUF1501 domain-containing protein [Polyangiaceae bacterium]
MTSPDGTLTRRAALSLLAAGSVELVARPVGAEPARSASPAGGVFVCVFLRGAADGLNVVVPYTERDYYRLRPTIAVARPGKPHGALDLDGRFGLNPRLAALKPAYDAGEIALVHAVGSSRPTRSHFEAQDAMQTATPGERAPRDGFLARALAARPASDDAAVRAVAFTERVPLALRGYEPALSVERLDQLKSFGDPALGDGFEKLYAAGNAPATRSGKRALAAVGRLQSVAQTSYTPENAASYEPGARSFADVARLIKADVGLEIAWIDVGGWDTHKYQGGAERGDLPKRLDTLGKALAAFRADLGARLEHVTVLVMTEFGRTVAENGTGGTDHGAGSVMLVLGGSVRGGRVYGDFRGLSRDALYEGRDVAATTDYRTVFAEIIRKRLEVRDVSRVFPGYSPSAPSLGFLD